MENLLDYFFFFLNKERQEKWNKDQEKAANQNSYHFGEETYVTLQYQLTASTNPHTQ